MKHFIYTLFIFSFIGSIQISHAQVNNDNLYIYYVKLTEKYNDPANWSDETKKIIHTHANFLHDLGKKGILAFAGRTKFNPDNENLFGIVVFLASSLNEAKSLMADDPSVVKKIQKAEIFPFSMGIRYLDNLEKKMD